MVYERKPLRIVRTWYSINQGTGEGPYRETEDGRVWHDARSYETDGSMTAAPELRTQRGGYLW